jgi:hypothetical protein
MDWWYDSRDRVLALQAQSPEFKPQATKKKKKQRRVVVLQIMPSELDPGF